jgi:hypothetical protein
MSRKYLSGAQKRKLSNERESVAAAQRGSLLKFMRAEQDHVNSDRFEIENLDLVQEIQETNFVNVSTEQASETDAGLTNAEATVSTEEPAQDTVDTVDAERSEINWDVEDIGKWPRLLNNKLREHIIQKGPVSSEGQGIKYPRDVQGRKFTENFYYRKLSNCELVHRRWLIYSKSADAVFCFACKVFGSINFNIATVGVNDWKNISNILHQHEKSQYHLENMHKWLELVMRLNANKTIDAENQKLLEAEKQHWRNVLERIISIVGYLSKNNLAFRGSVDKLHQPRNGNFLGLVELLGKYDTVMNEHLRRINGNEVHDHYLGPRIQNEIITLMSCKVTEEIISLISLAKYFSVILDCTPDISHQEQMSLILRYVDISDSEQITVKESFITFLKVDDTTGRGLLQTLLDELQRLGLSMANIRGQGYDNGANMRGRISGVQARLLEQNPRAFFVPCACHSLNLVLCDMAKSSVDAISFFGLCQRIYVLFSASTQRWEIFKRNVPGNTVKPLCETRWESRVESVRTLRYQSLDIYDALVEVSEEARDPKAKSEAESLANEITSFKFLTSIVIWYDILVKIEGVSKVMQSTTLHLGSALTLLNNTRAFLVKYRDTGFKEAQVTAKELAEALGVEPKFSHPSIKRISRKKRQHDYEGIDDPIVCPEKKFQVEFFNVVIDKAISAVDERFSSLEVHHENFGFLYDMKKLNEIAKNELMEKCTKLEKILSQNDSSDLNGIELYEELNTLPSILPNAKSVLDIMQFIHNNQQMDSYPNVYIALRILMTMPVTVATGERSFSKLKLIKNYLRSTMSQERLTGLAILSIEQGIASSLSYDSIITEFANRKARKINFD